MLDSTERRPVGHSYLLRVQDLSAGYGGQPIVQNASLDVMAGEVVVVLGPNGSGKSTFVKAVAGVIPAMTGSVVALDIDVTGWSTDRLVRQGVGYVPQLNDTFSSLTVHDNLQMGGYQLSKQDLAAGMARVLELFPALRPLLKRSVQILSGGERKMVGIARALIASPRVILFDEPTAGLAPETGERVLAEAVRASAEGGAAILLIEQRADQALRVADRGVVFVGGRVVAADSAEKLREEGLVADLFLGSSQ